MNGRSGATASSGWLVAARDQRVPPAPHRAPGAQRGLRPGMLRGQRQCLGAPVRQATGSTLGRARTFGRGQEGCGVV